MQSMVIMHMVVCNRLIITVIHHIITIQVYRVRLTMKIYQIIRKFNIRTLHLGTRIQLILDLQVNTYFSLYDFLIGL